MTRILEMWFQLYLKLTSIKPSETWLAVRLDTSPDRQDFEQRNVRIRVTAGEGNLIHDEIRTVVGIVDEFIDSSDLPIQTEIQNNGIEITSLVSFKGDSDGGRDEDQVNATTWLRHLGKIQTAIKTAGPDFVAGWLAEAAFGSDVRVALQDGRVGIISGFVGGEDGHASQGNFTVDIISPDEESHQYVMTEDTVSVGIDEIVGVITYDDDELRRGSVEPLKWQD